MALVAAVEMLAFLLFLKVVPSFCGRKLAMILWPMAFVAFFDDGLLFADLLSNISLAAGEMVKLLLSVSS